MNAFDGIIEKANKARVTIINLNKLFIEVIIGNRFDKEALKILKRKKNLRIIDSSNFKLSDNMKIVSTNESILIQSEDSKILTKKDFKIVSKKKPSKMLLKK